MCAYTYTCMNDYVCLRIPMTDAGLAWLLIFSLEFLQEGPSLHPVWLHILRLKVKRVQTHYLKSFQRRKRQLLSQIFLRERTILTDSCAEHSQPSK